MPTSLTTLRQRFYAWRQRRPLQRFFAALVLVVAWPVRFVLLRVWRLFSSGETPRRVVVIQLAGLGDVLMATPAWAALQQHYPGVQLDLITLHGYVTEAFQNHPRLNSVRTLPPYSGKWIIPKFVNKSSAQLLAAVIRYYPDLVLRNFSRATTWALASLFLTSIETSETRCCFVSMFRSESVLLALQISC